MHIPFPVVVQRERLDGGELGWLLAGDGDGLDWSGRDMLLDGPGRRL